MEEIDAVITWVDGSDPIYQSRHKDQLEKRRDFKKQYMQEDEIVLCASSIIKFAPFIRKVFIVTDGQSPNLNEIRRFVATDKISIIDHKEIFEGFESFLPTFNIRSIDALLYKIKGLSEKFIYFNDDMFLIKESSASDWFENNKGVLTGNWAKTYNTQPLKKIANTVKNILKIRPSYNAGQSMAANIAGFDKEYFKSYHCGRPQVRSVIKGFYKYNPGLLRKQLSYKFRNVNQYVPYSLCWHLLIKDANYNTAPKDRHIEIEKIRNYSPVKLKKTLINLDKNEDLKFLNIQDLNYTSMETIEIFKNWFYSKLTS